MQPFKGRELFSRNKRPRECVGGFMTQNHNFKDDLFEFLQSDHAGKDRKAIVAEAAAKFDMPKEVIEKEIGDWEAGAGRVEKK